MSETLERDVLFRKLRARPENKVRLGVILSGLRRCSLQDALSIRPIGSALWQPHRTALPRSSTRLFPHVSLTMLLDCIAIPAELV